MESKLREYKANSQNKYMPRDGISFYNSNEAFCKLFHKSCIDGGAKASRIINLLLFDNPIAAEFKSDIFRNSIIDELKTNFRSHFYYDTYNAPYLTGNDFISKFNRFGKDKKLLIPPNTDRRKEHLQQNTIEFGEQFNYIIQGGYSYNDLTDVVDGVYLSLYTDVNVIKWTYDITDIKSVQTVDYTHGQEIIDLPEINSRNKISVRKVKRE